MSAATDTLRLRPADHDLRQRTRRRRLVRGGLVALCLLYLGVLVLGPLVAIVWSATKQGFGTIAETLTMPDVTHALFLSTVITIQTVLVTALLGCVAAWVLVRHRFVGRKLLNALVELPLAVSPVTVGLAAVLLFGRGGWFEQWFTARGIQVIFALPSMVLVTIFICIPFVIRSVAPVLEELGTEEEDAARTLGATSFQTLFRVVLPNIRWGLLYGIALTTARAIGEIGAVLIVSGIVKGQTETATIYILTAYEERLDTQGNIIALLLAGVSIVLLIGIELFKHRHVREVIG
ncbi:MAG: sulfate ABC transporter permease subunit [Actinomycetota bacterium]